MKDGILDSINALDRGINFLKPQFEKYISDKCETLEERWDVWTKAPTYLKNHKSCIYHMYFDSTELTECLMSDYYIEKYETVDLAHFICRVEENLYEEYISGILPDDKVHALNVLKETILKDNIGSFVNDW